MLGGDWVFSLRPGFELEASSHDDIFIGGLPCSTIYMNTWVKKLLMVERKVINSTLCSTVFRSGPARSVESVGPRPEDKMGFGSGLCFDPRWTGQTRV